jgi:hypothetical protein
VLVGPLQVSVRPQNVLGHFEGATLATERTP